MIESVEVKLRQLFQNKSDCYADTLDDSDVLAMTEDRFVEVVMTYLKEKHDNY